MMASNGGAETPPLKTLFALLLRRADQNIFILITLSFLGGIINAHSQFVIFPEALARAVVILLTGMVFLCYLSRKSTSPLSFPFLLIIFFLLGHLILLHRLQEPQASGHIASLLKERQKVTLVGTLATMIEERVIQQDGQEHILSRFEIEAEDILFHEKEARWQPVHGRVRLSMQARKDELQPGMRLMVLAKAGPVGNFKTPGIFDYQGYLAAQDIFITGWLPGDTVTVLREPLPEGLLARGRSLGFFPEQVRQQVSRFIRDTLPCSLAGTYQALLIGSRAGVPQEIQEQFKATGTMHLLAISGLHMGLLALMVGALISQILKRSEQLLLRTHVPTLTLLMTLPVLLGYSFIAGMNTPVFRALIMTFVLYMAFVLRRQHSLLHLLAAAALIILVQQPLALFTASFQLSFGAVASLMLFFPHVFPASLDDDENKGTTGILDRLVYLWQRFLRPALLISLVATLGTLPFLVLHFHRFSVIGPVMNLLVEPVLCFWALPWGLAAIPCLYIAPELASVFLWIGSLGIQAGHCLVVLGNDLPWASVWTITPSGAELVCYGGLLLLWLATLKMERLRWVAQGSVLLGAGLLGLHFTWGLFFAQTSNQSRVCYLDVGQGTSTFLHTANGSRILIDGGGNRQSRRNIGEQIIAPYLWKQRVWRLDQAVITHPHSDHFNGMDFILARFRPKQLFINNDPRVEGKYQDILEQAVQQGIEIVVPGNGYEMIKEENASLTILSGAAEQGQRGKGNVNDGSLVLRYQHGQRAFLFPGDMSRDKERVLLEKRINMRADVLLAPHHGSSSSSSADFLDAVGPGLIIVSAGNGEHAKKYYPASVNLTAWAKRGIPYVLTREQGTISCTTDGEALRCVDWAGQSVMGSDL
uniref:DNA internalization-related competence protein ComEC/Rec2 n=1 Tax=Candidatus Electrothrix sp. TaxID=2170559 RepID=UPI0040573303